MANSVPNPSGATNIYTLAADGASERLLAALRQDPSLVNSQDSSGYSLVHALASYGHLELLLQVKADWPALNPNLLDEDGETALFVVESVAAAECLVDKLHIDWRIRNEAGETAEDKIRTEGDFVTVADYLAQVRTQADSGTANSTSSHSATAAGTNHANGTGSSHDVAAAAPTLPPTTGASQTETGASGSSSQSSSSSSFLPPLPPGVRMEMGTVAQDGDGDAADELEPDPAFKARIEELAARDDFQSAEGQAQLRALVQDAVREVNSGDRDTRQRTS